MGSLLLIAVDHILKCDRLHFFFFFFVFKIIFPEGEEKKK